MPTIFLLIRHAATNAPADLLVGRMPNVHLSTAGERSARQLADELSKHPVTAVWSSPMERAIETALPIAHTTGTSVYSSSKLTEIDYGSWTGRTFDELSADPLWKEFNTRRELTRIPSGEIIGEVRTRVLGLLDELRERHRGALIVLVTHAEVIRVALDHYCARISDPNCDSHVAPASVSIVRVEPTIAVMTRNCEAARVHEWLSHSA